MLIPLLFRRVFTNTFSHAFSDDATFSPADKTYKNSPVFCISVRFGCPRGSTIGLLSEQPWLVLSSFSLCFFLAPAPRSRRESDLKQGVLRSPGPFLQASKRSSFSCKMSAGLRCGFRSCLVLPAPLDGARTGIRKKPSILRHNLKVHFGRVATENHTISYKNEAAKPALLPVSCLPSSGLEGLSHESSKN